MEMCNVIADGMEKVRDLTEQAYKEAAKGNLDSSTRLLVVANGIMLSCICHALFNHDHEGIDPELWRGLFGGEERDD